MRTTRLAFVSAAAMTLSAALVYFVTPAGGVARDARADAELEPTAMLEPDSEWFRAVEAAPGAATAQPTSAPASTGLPTIADFAASNGLGAHVAQVTSGATPPLSEPRVVRSEPLPPELFAFKKVEPPRAGWRNPKPAFVESKQARFVPAQPAPQQVAPQQMAPQQMAPPRSTSSFASAPAPTSSARFFGSKK
jgi:hypothetical protein